MARRKRRANSGTDTLVAVEKGYVSNVFRQLRVVVASGQSIQFVNGLFRTSDPAVQEALDNADPTNHIVPE